MFSMVQRIRIPDPAIFLYGSGSREMIRILRIRIRNTDRMGFLKSYYEPENLLTLKRRDVLPYSTGMLYF